MELRLQTTEKGEEILKRAAPLKPFTTALIIIAHGDDASCFHSFVLISYGSPALWPYFTLSSVSSLMDYDVSAYLSRSSVLCAGICLQG